MLLPITIQSYWQIPFANSTSLNPLSSKQKKARNVAKSRSYSSTKALQAVAVAGELRACIHARRARNQVKLRTVAALMV
jgi:hypothetical protein